MSKKYTKTITREIRSSFGRFAAIIAIVALGVGFLVGVLSSTPDMKTTVNEYYAEYAMSDFDLKSTMGFTEKDINAIKNIEEVETVMPARVTDALVSINSSSTTAGRIYGLDMDNITVNKPELIEGCMPENRTECVIEKPTSSMDKVRIGDTVTISDENEDIDDTYQQTEFTVVGIVNNPYYFCSNKEPASVGTGRTGVILYTWEDAYDMDVFTDIFVLTSYDAGAFSDDYDDYIDKVTEKIEAVSDVRIPDRHEEVVGEAMDEILEAKSTLKSERADAEAELADAENKLTEGQQEYDNGVAELNDAKDQLADGREEVDSARDEINDGRTELDNAKTELDSAKAELEAGKAELDAGRTELDAAGAELEAGKAELDATKAELADGEAELDKAETELIANKARLDEVKAQLDANTETVESTRAAREAGISLAPEVLQQIEIYDQTTAQWEAGMAEWQTAYTQWENAVAQWEAGMVTWQESYTQWENGMAALETAEAEWEAGMAEWQTGYAQWENSVTEYENGLAELNDAETEIESAENELDEAAALIAENESKLEDAADDLAEGRRELAEGRAEAESKFAEAEAEIADAEEEVSEIEEPEWYILDRHSNLSYAKYAIDVEKVADIATVFPIFFFLIAALVSLTTMTRMVEEERIQIGTLKALGYRRRTIASKYLVYCGVATLIGCIIGLSAGFKLLPNIIFMTFETQYDLPPLMTELNPGYALLSCGLEFLCTIGATWMACSQTLREKPSALMIPRAPKAGKRILMERITFIWKRLSFTHKATARNIFRYKKHLFMTVIGIAGCTALMVAGFGIKDSINALVTTQFDDLLKYDMRIELTEDNSDETLDDFLKDKDTLPMSGSTVDVKSGNNKEQISSTLFIPQDSDRLQDFVNLRDRRTHDTVPFESDSVLITEKMADVLEVSPGDIITVVDTDGAPSDYTLTGTIENYAGCYVYISSDEYLKKNRSIEYNCYLLDSGATGQEAQDEITARLLKSDYVSSVEFTSQSRDTYQQVLDSLSFIVYVLVVFSGLLAVVVLYNLTNININERIRELATLRVLGYHHKEVALYIFREIGILTVLGTAFGLLLGKVLHYYIVIIGESTDMAFGREVEPMSFILAAVFTLIFSALVDVLMMRKLRKIDMAASMKAVD